MTNRQKNWFNMLLEVLAVMAKDTTWQSVPKIVECHTRIVEIKLLIETKRDKQETSMLALGKESDALKERICILADIANDTLCVLAKIEGNYTLAAEMDKSKSDLYKSRNIDLLKHLARVKSLVVANQENLTTNYGYSEANVTELFTAIDEWEEINSSQTHKRVDSRESTETLSELFGELLPLVHEKLDNLMSIFKTSRPQLHKEYVAARTIIDRPASRGKSNERPEEETTTEK